MGAVGHVGPLPHGLSVIVAHDLSGDITPLGLQLSRVNAVDSITRDAAGKVARVICDIYNPDGSSFAGCTRQALKRQIAKAKTLGYEMMAGVEAEFFIDLRELPWWAHGEFLTLGVELFDLL